MHGPVQFYEVHFRDAEPGGRVDIMHNVTVPVGVQRRLDFTNLEIYWLYGVRIKAFTSLGPGPLSKEITGRTDEWGKKFIARLPWLQGLIIMVIISIDTNSLHTLLTEHKSQFIILPKAYI